MKNLDLRKFIISDGEYGWCIPGDEHDLSDLLKLAALGQRFLAMQEDRKAILAWAREEKIPVITALPERE